MATLPIETFEPSAVSSPYGWRTIYGQREMHYGIDYPCSVGTPVLAYAAGTVYVSKMQNGGGGLGEYVTVRHGLTYTMYAHLSQRVVKAGQKVAEGTLLGYSGNTGRSTGPHLHFGICTGYVASSVNKSKWRDPLPELKKIIAEGEKSSMRTLKKGMKGTDVKMLQYLLRIPADGSFGPATDAAVREYQGWHYLKVDGLVGPKTQDSLRLYDFTVRVFAPQELVFFAGAPYGTTRPPLHTLSDWARETGAAKVWNLAMFNFGDHQTINYLKAQGVDVGYGGVPERVQIDWKNVVGGYKVGIRNGRRAGGSITGKRSRNAVGVLRDGRFFIVQSLYCVTEYALVSYMLKHYDVDTLLFEDGGGSTGFYDAKRGVLIAPEQEGKAGRPVASVCCLKEVG